jgi:hypothetical protein
MEDVDGADFSVLNERTNGLSYGFDFREFGHKGRRITEQAST